MVKKMIADCENEQSVPWEWYICPRDRSSEKVVFDSEGLKTARKQKKSGSREITGKKRKKAAGREKNLYHYFKQA